MQSTTPLPDRVSLVRISRRFLFTVVATTTLCTSTSWAVGLTYVDADDGVNIPGGNLAPLAAIRLTEPAVSNDDLWNFRSDGGVVSAGGIFKNVYEASGGTTTEDAPEITQTLSGLSANAFYDVYAVYWQGAQPSHNWNVRAGFTSGNLQLFNAKGPSEQFPEAVAGTNSLYFDWASPPVNPATQVAMLAEAGRTLLLGKIGTASSTGTGQLTVFVDDLPAAVAGSPNENRSWFEGIAYVPVGTDVYLAPGDLNLDGSLDAADAGIFLANLHTNVSSLSPLETYRLGDLNGDTIIGYSDFVQFKAIYNDAHGAGSFEAITGVPEPNSALSLAILVGLFLCGAASREKFRKRSALDFWTSRGRTYSLGCTSCILILTCIVSNGTAAPVTNWVAISPADGTPSTKPFSGALTDSPTLGDGTDNSAAQVALYADIDGTLDGSPDVHLANGQRVTLTGSASFSSIVSSQEQFRFGLFNEDTAPFDAFAWRGFIANNSAGGSGGALRAKNAASSTFNTSTFVQTSASGQAVNLRTAQDGGAFVDGTYQFRMSISRFDDELSVDASLTSDSGWSQVWTNAITSDPDLVTYSFNRVGFLAGNPMAANQIQFHGIDVSIDTAKALTLQVTTTGPNAGRVQIRNLSGEIFHIDYYEIQSASGSLNLAGWNSLDDQEGSDPVAQGWDEAGGSSSNLISEVNIPSQVTVGAETSLFLGNAYSVGSTQDLKFFYGLDDGSLARGIVQYVTGSLAGDYNGNGNVDAADYTLWRDSLGQNVPNGSGADGDNDGVIGPGDFTVWKSNFGQSAGSGAVAAPSVPEPTVFGLLLTIAGAKTMIRPQRRGRLQNENEFVLIL